MHLLPARLADGREWVPQVMVDNRHLIATDKPARNLLMIDIPRRLARRLADLGTAELTEPATFAVGSGHVAWWTSAGELWAVPLTGGTPHRVATLDFEPPVLPVDAHWLTDPLILSPWLADQLVLNHGAVYLSRVEQLVITRQVNDRTIAFSTTSGRGVLRVPLSGGDPVPVPGTKGHQILTWPWLGKLPPYRCIPGPAGGCSRAGQPIPAIDG